VAVTLTITAPDPDALAAALDALRHQAVAVQPEPPRLAVLPGGDRAPLRATRTPAPGGDPTPPRSQPLRGGLGDHAPLPGLRHARAVAAAPT
jgi:hypothetical protein